MDNLWLYQLELFALTQKTRLKGSLDIKSFLPNF